MKKGKKKPASAPGPAANLMHESLVKSGTVHGGPNSSVKFGMDGRCAQLRTHHIVSVVSVVAHTSLSCLLKR